MANIDAALLTLDALHHWKPGAAIMVGLAAAANEEQHLGDIIVGSDVYYYERGKVKQEGVKPEPKMYPADATLWNNVNALPNWTTDILAARPDGTANRPTVRKGVIASGEKVIAYEASRDQIASGHRKIRAIEMEGYGFSAAVWQSFHQVRHLVIRGICDLADLSKNDEWHSYAAAAVASFAKHFLLDRPIEPRNILRSRDSLTQP
jgi:nucleoside phosphorylase